MSTHVKYNINVKVEIYFKDGQEKGKFKTVGQVMEKDDGSRYIYIDPFFNFGAVNRSYKNKNGETVISNSVLCSLKEPQDNNNQQQKVNQEEE